MVSSNEQSDVMDTLKDIHQTQAQLLAAVESLSERFDSAMPGTETSLSPPVSSGKPSKTPSGNEDDSAPPTSSDSVIRSNLSEEATLQAPAPASPNQRSGLTSRIVLTCVDYAVLALSHSICLHPVGHIPSKLVLTRFI